MSDKPKQLNFNSFILVVIGALVTFGIKKLDEINTNIIQVHTQANYLEYRISRIEDQIKRTP